MNKKTVASIAITLGIIGGTYFGVKTYEKNTGSKAITPTVDPTPTPEIIYVV